VQSAASTPLHRHSPYAYGRFFKHLMHRMRGFGVLVASAEVEPFFAQAAASNCDVFQQRHPEKASPHLLPHRASHAAYLTWNRTNLNIRVPWSQWSQLPPPLPSFPHVGETFCKVTSPLPQKKKLTRFTNALVILGKSFAIVCNRFSLTCSLQPQPFRFLPVPPRLLGASGALA
jgi:hypothetical protein